jgi:hypothetical protein
MSKIDELKKQHKALALSNIDKIKLLCPNKYVELYINLYNNFISSHYIEDNEQRTLSIGYLLQFKTINLNYLETLETPVLYELALNLGFPSMLLQVSKKNFETFFKFIEFNERNLIENKDVTSYKSWKELEEATSLAQLKIDEKLLEKQIIKIHEDDEWLVLKPLSIYASSRYGTGTKWCTTMINSNHFAKYSKWGILIYNINKKTGFKFATFKNLDITNDVEFWNVEDEKFDPKLDVHVPTYIYAIIVNEVRINPKTNYEIIKSNPDYVPGWSGSHDYNENSFFIPPFPSLRKS